MISRRRREHGYCSDDLDVLIRIALRDSVAGAKPPPRVWKRIEERVRRLAVAGWPRGQTVFDQQWIFPSLVRVSRPYLCAGSAFRIC